MIQKIIKLSFVFLLTISFIKAEENTVDESLDFSNRTEINILLDKVNQIENTYKENILIKRYLNYLSYSKIANELEVLKQSLKNKRKLSDEQEYQLLNKIRVKENELELIGEYKGSPIGGLINPPEIDKIETLTNPFEIIGAFSNIKKLEQNRQQFLDLERQLEELLKILKEELDIYSEINALEQRIEISEKILYLDKQRRDFEIVLDIVSTTSEVFRKKTEQVILETKNEITAQFQKMLNISFIIMIFFGVTFLVKMVLKKYYIQNENYYMVNKILNFSLAFLILMVLLFSYIDNVAYLVTILGFASAGIAIALKDWFMSLFGWMVIVTSGFIQVGDRIRVTKGEVETVGDVLDISLFKITIKEDITMVSYYKNRRAGRIFFVPNNYIFSELISNYSHSELKTIWDGIDITITFDSNHKKAQKIIREILKHYSKGYSDITRKQLSKMRNKYQLRATGVEPRVFTFIEPYGVVISGWYLTNSFAALVLRSTVSTEILDALMKEEDISIAYPTQQLNINETKNAYGSSRAKEFSNSDIDDIMMRR
ncbi:MAG TPA: mechanosensitive ion channel [Aliarcobacter thereius]|uniref:Mechanosensitive ion channel n=1 Tax=Aliarcobacter thereius TaxID=544718 RepID=A0A5R9HBC8_9BACT|nr:mechanosensitive ion channel domain-containing protein [Aliarcobacter thereius]TLS71977.1 mechanosensitive ion channel [Aliarcobacter thereius]HJE03194.1 mechanosensitive ion channel [Aliarcobacter thereius]